MSTERHYYRIDVEEHGVNVDACSCCSTTLYSVKGYQEFLGTISEPGDHERITPEIAAAIREDLLANLQAFDALMARER